MQFFTFALAALSVGSVLSAPTTTPTVPEPKVLTSAISAVSSSKSNVDTQVAIIKKFVDVTVNDAAIPALKSSLNNIASEIATATKFVVPLVTDVVLPLAEQELANVPGFVGNVKAIAADVEYTANLLLANLSKQTLLLVKTEVLLVLATIDPFVKPVAQFANAAVKGTSGPSTVVIGTTVATTQEISGRISGPITSAYNKLV
ncbi:hypothetical protein F4808DRAFT_315620 [Astrocystis sublimbata]|nr:hypothetical protein F4808DRAFT_315620 [Astrocystis sublimbata]